MEKKTKRAGVIGAGVMGSAIAAHLANAGIETVLLDIVPFTMTEEERAAGLTQESKTFRNRLARNGLATALKAKPAAFYIPENAKLITIGNMEDDLHLLGDVDVIIEAVVERLDIKKQVFGKIETVLKPGTIIASNTSGLAAKDMSEGRTDTFRKHFAITHFFNPPRYMKLLEVVPGPDTLPEVMDRLKHFSESMMGKGVVRAKDTPNFVANRVGTYGLFCVMQGMKEFQLSVEAVDKLTGPIIGHPRSASFRTADLVGIDTLAHVTNNVYDGVPHDECREIFKVPEFMQNMLDKGFLGEKSGKGFYKKDKDAEGKRVILSIDVNTLEYKPQEKVKFGSLAAAAQAGSTKNKIKTLYYAKDVAGEFTFKHTSQTMIYAALRIPEISDDIITIDNAMKWGFAWKLGPFETWDALGVSKSVEKIKEAGMAIPGWVDEMLANGNQSFYKSEGGVQYYYDVPSKDYKPIQIKSEIILLPSLKDRNKKVAGNDGASLVDIGDGVVCLEFHSKMNAIGDEIISMANKAVEIIPRDFEGLVIANHAENFSVGATLPIILFTAQEEEWDDLDWMVKEFQNAFMKLKYMDKPVVAAPAGMALGGGCEVCLAADRVRFAAETYMGLVEAGVGLIPAGGGSKEMLLRNTENLFEVGKGGLYPCQIELKPFVARAFEAIAMAKVATAGPEAVKMGFLRRTDKLTVNRDHLIHDAKNMVLGMVKEGYVAPRPRDDIRVAGDRLLAMIKLGLHSMHKSGYVTDHDLVVAEKLAWVLCGGDVVADTVVTEQYLLDLEREAFLSLAGTAGTQARIEHMLNTGKPLRN